MTDTGWQASALASASTLSGQPSAVDKKAADKTAEPPRRSREPEHDQNNSR